MTSRRCEEFCKTEYTRRLRAHDRQPIDFEGGTCKLEELGRVGEAVCHLVEVDVERIRRVRPRRSPCSDRASGASGRGLLVRSAGRDGWARVSPSSPRASPAPPMIELSGTLMSCSARRPVARSDRRTVCGHGGTGVCLRLVCTLKSRGAPGHLTDHHEYSSARKRATGTGLVEPPGWGGEIVNTLCTAIHAASSVRTAFVRTCATAEVGPGTVGDNLTSRSCRSARLVGAIGAATDRRRDV